jgi:RimJ/RimL family protein N-acetyltransferase
MAADAMSLLDEQIDVATARLALRPLREGDADRLHALFADWEVMRWLSSPPWPYGLDDARDFIAMRRRPDPDYITAAITRDGDFIGSVDAIIKPASSVQRERGYSVGYWLGRPYWGRGYMSEAAAAFVGRLFASIPDETIYSGAFAANAASLRIQEKLGFCRDGEGPFFSTPNGREMPHVSTSLTRARFAARER